MAALALSACGIRPPVATPDRGSVGEGTSTVVVPTTACPTVPPDLLASLMKASITAKDAGKTLVLHQTDRFSIYLDDRVYPLAKIQTSPPGRLGIVTNGAIRGPDCYPIMYEAVSEGKAVLSDGDFQLEIVVDNSAPVSQIPLP